MRNAIIVVNILSFLLNACKESKNGYINLFFNWMVLLLVGIQSFITIWYVQKRILVDLYIRIGSHILKLLHLLNIPVVTLPYRVHLLLCLPKFTARKHHLKIPEKGREAGLIENLPV